YIPGHAHADTLSLEISLAGARLITNTGTSTYAPGPEREAERATSAHATVELDGANSSEVWASFRVGRRARPASVSTKVAGGALQARGAHDGYRFLAGRPVHARDVRVTAGAVSIVDRIEGGGRHAAVGRFPLHPDVDKVEQIEGGFRLVMPDGRAVRVAVAGADALAIEQGHYAPEFGICRPRPVLVWRAARDLPIEVTVEFLA
ncbi:MAG: heparinase II/III-family protein, partial [Nitratireductor sp.]